MVPGPEIKRFRRVVTGHDAQGQSIITSDAATPHIMPIMGQPNFAVIQEWTKAEVYAKTIALFADKLGGSQKSAQR